ncbi:MAG: hypothetical protein GY847_04625 [Proteobacteria bacterium]|nr:hypothetical protein [Pseudomonadota bacterium]
MEKQFIGAHGKDYFDDIQTIRKETTAMTSGIVVKINGISICSLIFSGLFGFGLTLPEQNTPQIIIGILLIVLTLLFYLMDRSLHDSTHIIGDSHYPYFDVALSGLVLVPWFFFKSQGSREYQEKDVIFQNRHTIFSVFYACCPRLKCHK